MEYCIYPNFITLVTIILNISIPLKEVFEMYSFFIVHILTNYLYFLILFYAVVNQFYQTRVIDEYVLLGNAAVLKCLIPSFVTDFVQVLGWVDDNGINIGITVDKQGTHFQIKNLQYE